MVFAPREKQRGKCGANAGQNAGACPAPVGQVMLNLFPIEKLLAAVCEHPLFGVTADQLLVFQVLHDPVCR